MEAKDTVMSDEQIAQYMNTPQAHAGGDDCFWDLDSIVQTQAEITFPLGERKGVEKGRREVAVWIKKQHCYTADELKVRLEAKLKEWGVE